MTLTHKRCRQATPEWITQDFHGTTKYGLFKQCDTMIFEDAEKSVHHNRVTPDKRPTIDVLELSLGTPVRKTMRVIHGMPRRRS